MLYVPQQVYVDINSDEVIALEGYEEQFGYVVKKVLSSFPFEEYGSKGVITIPESQFKEVVGIDNSIGKSR